MTVRETGPESERPRTEPRMRPRRLVTADGRRRDFGKMKPVESDEALGARGRFHASAMPPG